MVIKGMVQVYVAKKPIKWEQYFMVMVITTLNILHMDIVFFY